jgi:hypothetical protein
LRLRHLLRLFQDLPDHKGLKGHQGLKENKVHKALLQKRVQPANRANRGSKVELEVTRSWLFLHPLHNNANRVA